MQGCRPLAAAVCLSGQHYNQSLCPERCPAPLSKAHPPAMHTAPQLSVSGLLQPPSHSSRFHEPPAHPICCMAILGQSQMLKYIYVCSAVPPFVSAAEKRFWVIPLPSCTGFHGATPRAPQSALSLLCDTSVFRVAVFGPQTMLRSSNFCSFSPSLRNRGLHSALKCRWTQP
jgi:hypothetical protein